MHKENCTGLILAGGRGSRMGGINKGLQNFQGKTLLENAIERLAPQVQTILISANTELARFQSIAHPLAYPIISDPNASQYAGPLAGILAGLQNCKTPYLLVIPVDTPRFPLDLLAILGAKHEQNRSATQVHAINMHPVFCLLPTTLTQALESYLHNGERRVSGFLDSVHCQWSNAADEHAFANANTLEELRVLERLSP